MSHKDDLQDRARALGLSADGTVEELEARIAETEKDDGVASAEDNARLEHSRGGATTRDDLHDTGVPMLQGSPAERQGPEDALGEGEKRGDYRERVPGAPHTAVALEGGGAPIYRNDSGDVVEAGADGAVLVDYAPVSAVVPQKPRTEDIGDAEGLKGGVQTDPLAEAAARAAV